jgi:hypothetical protein
MVVHKDDPFKEYSHLKMDPVYPVKFNTPELELAQTVSGPASVPGTVCD